MSESGKSLKERFGWIEPVLEASPDGRTFFCPPAAARALASLASIYVAQRIVWSRINNGDALARPILDYFTGRLG